LSQASTASELSTFLVAQAERRGEGSAAAKSSQTTEFNDLLARAQSRGYISESALRRVEIESERNAFWFGPSTVKSRMLICAPCGPALRH